MRPLVSDEKFFKAYMKRKIHLVTVRSRQWTQEQETVAEVRRTDLFEELTQKNCKKHKHYTDRNNQNTQLS